ncbi:helix-turn-helix domain-containing protein [Streptomyces buecherae]|uniref:helix-turn-helix domain-containing protein n=1 Tax=Streptomyces buecherae TaxID=2763006 RepID=UPI0027DFED0C|nr:helix-turn-helix transcriptional regulator [Streptomyces buecherae]
MKHKTPSGRTTSAELFGELVRQLRIRAGLTQDQLASALPVDRSLIAHIEAGKRRPDPEHVKVFDKLLDAGGLLVEMCGKVDWYSTHPAHPDWFKKRAEMDARAVGLRVWQTQLVPGLLQTPDYARAVFTREGLPPEQVEDRVQARLSRQERFLEIDGPPLRVVLEESVLYNVVGGSHVMHDQCAHLLNVSRTANTVIQVLLAERKETPRPSTSLWLITLPQGREVLYSESVNSGHFVNDPTVVRNAGRTYDLLRTESLSASETATLISDVMGRYDQGEDPRTQRGYMAQEQLQRRQRRRVHRGSPRIPRRRPRP